MIAKVRIAPSERWCERMQEKLLRNPLLAKVSGLEVEIVTETGFSAANSKGQIEWHWEVTNESYRRMCHAAGRDPSKFTGTVICQSMLEMD